MYARVEWVGGVRN